MTLDDVLQPVFIDQGVRLRFVWPAANHVDLERRKTIIYQPFGSFDNEVIAL